MSSVTIGRIGNASAFWRASSLCAASVKTLALLEDDLAVLARDVGAGVVRQQLRVVVGDGPLDLAVRASR